MTRKCIMCKSKNYKNTSSFFSAPKDHKTRLLWQKAINLENYVVNDETYVCSKHFNENDIITHWVSGVPPQVITIKYKKCRLRHGAVPITINDSTSKPDTAHLDNQNINTALNDKILSVEGNEGINSNNKIIESKYSKNKLSYCNFKDNVYREYVSEGLQVMNNSKNERNVIKISKKQKLFDNNILDKNQNDLKSENNKIVFVDCADFNKTNFEDTNDSHIHTDNIQDILTYIPKKNIKLNENEIQQSLQFSIEKIVDGIDVPVNFQVNGNTKKINRNELNTLRTINKEDKNKTFKYLSDSIPGLINCGSNNLLFEDFVKIYNNVSLPNKWCATLISKDQATTIVYYCMNISSQGIPYIEKKVFLNKEMIIRCGILNKEINVNKLFKRERSLRIMTLLDIEDFIEEFDLRSICTGFQDTNNLNESAPTMITFDSETWRRSECLMVINKGQSMCFRCASLTSNKNL